MPSPFVLNFRPGEALLDLNSVALGFGYAWGTIDMPVTKLDFSEDRIDRDYSTWRRNHPHATNEEIYNSCFSGNPRKEVFFGRRYNYHSTISGAVIGVGQAGILSKAGDAIEAALGWGRNAVASNVASSGILSETPSQSSTNPLLHGLNGHDTFNLDGMLLANSRYQVLAIQAAAGAIFEVSGTGIFIGNFMSWDNCDTMQEYLIGVDRFAFACAFVPQASAGLILPGADIKLLTT